MTCLHQFPVGVDEQLLTQRREQRLRLAQARDWLQRQMIPPPIAELPPAPLRYLVEKRLRDLAETELEAVQETIIENGHWLVAYHASQIVNNPNVDLGQVSTVGFLEAMGSIGNVLSVEHTQTYKRFNNASPEQLAAFRRLFTLLAWADELAGDLVETD